MCFSPEASFAGGIIILAIGVATVTKIHKPSQLVFACIPLFFGIQQITEGVLWISFPLSEHYYLQKTATYIFLIMADVLWPTLIPISVLLMERNKKKRSILWILFGIGSLLSLYYASCLLLFHVTPQVECYHIHYVNDFPKSVSMIASIFYLVATITPLFVSSIKRTHLLGVLMALSCLVTAIFFTQYLTSVWCFFAALISGVIFWILRDSKREFNLSKLKALEQLVKDKLHTL